MRTIYKYSLMPGTTDLFIPEDAQILDVHEQGGAPQIWLEVDLSAQHTNRRFVSVPTGGQVPDVGTYVGSAHGVDSWMVFHIYEVPRG